MLFFRDLCLIKNLILDPSLCFCSKQEIKKVVSLDPNCKSHAPLMGLRQPLTYNTYGQADEWEEGKGQRQHTYDNSDISCRGSCLKCALMVGTSSGTAVMLENQKSISIVLIIYSNVRCIIKIFKPSRFFGWVGKPGQLENDYGSWAVA